MKQRFVVGLATAIGAFALWVTPTEELNAAATPEAFIQEVAPDVRDISQQYQIYGSVQLAQAILESDYGRSRLTTSANNFFGVKGNYYGQSVMMPTMEDNGKGKCYRVTAAFKKYPNFHASLEDNARLLRYGLSYNPQFYAGAWREKASDYRAAARSLQGKYATDTHYADKLITIIERYHLDQLVDVNYSAIVNQQPLAGQAILRQNQRNDGLFSDGPYNTSAATRQQVASAGRYRDQTVTLLASATVEGRLWCRFQTTSGTYWVDRAALHFLDTAEPTQTVHYDAYVDQSRRSDGIYWQGPYNTSAATQAANDGANRYRGQTVTVTGEAKVGSVTWVTCRLNNRSVWLDKRALHANVNAKPPKDVNYRARIKQFPRNDGLFIDGPYNTRPTNRYQVASARDHNNQSVAVTREQVVGKTTWVAMTLNGRTVWMDKAGLVS